MLFERFIKIFETRQIFFLKIFERNSCDLMQNFLNICSSDFFAILTRDIVFFLYAFKFFQKLFLFAFFGKSLRILLRHEHIHTFFFKFFNFFFDFLSFGRHKIICHTFRATCFVQKINCFIRQKSICNIS